MDFYDPSGSCQLVHLRDARGVFDSFVSFSCFAIINVLSFHFHTESVRTSILVLVVGETTMRRLMVSHEKLEVFGSLILPRSLIRLSRDEMCEKRIYLSLKFYHYGLRYRNYSYDRLLSSKS